VTARSRPRAFHLIAEQIRDEIVKGRRKPGDRLPPEQVLAEQFSVSRTGVREALRVLEFQGLIQVRHGYAGGVFVADRGLAPVLGALETSLHLGQVEVSELYEARVILEPTVARLAVERADERLVSRMVANVERAQAVIAAGSEAFAINLEFHAILAEAAGNRVVALVMRALVQMLENLDRQYPTNPTVSSRAVDDHVRIIAALRAGDGAQAEALMLEHMRELEGRFTRIQDEMRRRRAARPRHIRPWGGVRLGSDAATGEGA